MKEDRSILNILTSKPTTERSLRRGRRRWEGNIKIYLKEIGVNEKKCSDLALVRDYWRIFVNVIKPPVSISHGISWFLHQPSRSVYKQ